MDRNDLKIHVADLTAPLEREIEIQTSRIDLQPDAPVRIALQITKCGKDALVQGTVKASLPAPCAACLAPAAAVVDEGLDLCIRIPADGEIDLMDTVRDALISGRPIRVTCSPGCRGLCPKCGANLNRGDCSCTPSAGKKKGSLGVALDEALDRGDF